jgi:hypothetical protein
VILKGSKEDLLKLIASATSTVSEEQNQQLPEAIATGSPKVQTSDSMKS